MIQKYKTMYSGLKIKLAFKNNLTIIYGSSRELRTDVFKAIEKDSLLGLNDFICLNIDDIKTGNIEHVLNNVKGRVIVIDRADAILNLEQKTKVSTDSDNQYIIFCDIPDGFKFSSKSLAELISDKNKNMVYLRHGV